MSPKTSREVRNTFLDFFAGKGHTVCPSAPLVLPADPTLMFVNAGMAPFKDVFTGKEKRAFTRAASSQKCIRISGKHNDLENVGVTARHHTFFEMLGNFSFGDYFKEEAITYAWELLTKVYELDTSRLAITVYGGDPAFPGTPADDEARAIWKKVTGFGDDRILGLGAKDNFWQMGDTGPCGPCTEIHYHLGGPADLSTFGEEPDASGRGWMEIWNNVFMQFERSREGDGFRLDPLPKPCVDTGMGLERIASVLDGKVTNYDTDVLRALVEKASLLSKKPYGGTLAPDDVSMRVIADHARMAAFTVAEGIFPDRAGREYVLRRVMRRAIRHGHRLGIDRPFLHEVALEVVERMGEDYPELVTRKSLIATTIEQEEVRFRHTIDRGLKVLDEAIAGTAETTISGRVAFMLSDTYGFPLDLTQVIAGERSLTVDEAGYEVEMKAARARSEGSKVGDAAIGDAAREALEALRAGGHEAVTFTGYEQESGAARVVALLRDGALVPVAGEGHEVGIVTERTPFYGESGGQVGDAGALASATARGTIRDTQKPLGGLFVHYARIDSGVLSVGDAVELTVDHARRSAIRRNHSATHLLHWALRTVLGEQATQKGSLVGPERLRFDFSHGKAVTHEELARIEDLVNDKVLTNAPVGTEVLPQAEARARGAMAIFEEKYGDTVRVLTMTADSVELCGGTHARALGDIGLFKIVSEGGIAAGVRRIEAVTGLNALGYVREVEGSLKDAARTLKSNPAELLPKIEKLLEKDRALEKEVAELKKKIAMGGGGTGAGGATGVDAWVQNAQVINGVKVLAQRIDTDDAATLRELAEQLRDKLGDAVVLVGAAAGGKASLVLTVSKSLIPKLKAGDLIKPIAAMVGGSGGGRPDMAQAGGPNVGELDAALAKLATLLG